MPQAVRRIYVLYFYKTLPLKFLVSLLTSHFSVFFCQIVTEVLTQCLFVCLFVFGYKVLGFIFFFYVAANAYSYVFKKAMEKIKEKDASAYYWLKDNEPLEHQVRIKFDPTLKSDDNQPFCGKLVGSRFDKRFQLASSWESKVTPYVEKKS